MTSFISNPVVFKSDTGKYLAFLKNLNNFEEIMPDQVENWISDEYQCSFFIRNLGDLGMKKGDFSIPDQILFLSTEKSKIGFRLIFHLNTSGDLPTGKFEILVEVNSMVELMLKRPLTNFVNILIANLCKVADC